MFVWAGQMWSVPTAGGTAHRVFNEPGEFRKPFFSPDGSRLAFGKAKGSDIDLFIGDAAGGAAKQATDHPKADILQAWAPDGDLVYTSSRERDGSAELYKQGLGDPMAMRFPVPEATQGCLSPDGNRLAYVPATFFGSLITRRAYRGGATGVIRILDLKTLNTEQLTKNDHNSVFPMWVGDQIYYLSDSRGSYNLAVYDFKTKKSRELTDFIMKGITTASYSSGLVSYVRDGRIYLYDIAAGSSREVPITIADDELKAPVDERAPRQTGVAPYVQWTTLSNDGKSVLFDGRGDIWLKPVDGAAVNLTKTPAVAERLPSMSPDGATIAYFTDATGEYQLAFRDVASGNTNMIAVESKPTFYRELTWSPDSAKVAFSDLRLGIWVADKASGKVERIDSSPNLAQEYWHPTWAGDRLIYSKAAPNGVRALYSWDAGTKRIQTLTDGYTSAEMPAATSANEVRFCASAFTLWAPGRNVWALQSSLMLSPLVASQLGAVSLGENAVTPFGDMQKDIVDIKAGKDGVIFVAAQDWGETPGDMNGPSQNLFRVSAGGNKWEKLATHISGFEISSDGSTLMCLGDRGNISLLPSDAPPADGDKNAAAKDVSLADAKVDVDPTEEWKQIYRDTFHMMRDRFYDANHHGQDVDELERHYAEYLPNITRRADLNTLLTLAFGEISISHLRVGGGDSPRPSGAPGFVGMLSADWAIDNNRYRVTKIYEQSDVLVTSPIAQTLLGTKVKVGDYLISVDGTAVMADSSLYSYFVGKANKPVTLTFSKSSDGSSPYEVKVKTVAGENTRRMLAWAEANAKIVDKETGGRIGYVYVAGYDAGGYQNLLRAIYASTGKDGLIIDQRFNGGGITSDVMIDMLKQLPILAYEYPYGNDFTVPKAYVDGPKVLIINQDNGSAAETFALMFKNAKLGTVVGTRTYGGGIGAGLSGVQLIDGGSVAIPNRAGYNPITGQWEIENDGVRPDVEVEWTPADFAAGRDTQLESAIKVAVEQARKWKKMQTKRPHPPVHPGGKAAG